MLEINNHEKTWKNDFQAEWNKISKGIKTGNTLGVYKSKMQTDRLSHRLLEV